MAENSSYRTINFIIGSKKLMPSTPRTHEICNSCRKRRLYNMYNVHNMYITRSLHITHLYY